MDARARAEVHGRWRARAGAAVDHAAVRAVAAMPRVGADPSRVPRLRVRRMAAPDLPRVTAIEAASFGRDAWPAVVFRELLAAFAQARPTRGALWVAEAAPGKVVGYAGVEVSGLRGEMDLINIAVAGECRRQGVGEQLLRHAIRHARRLGVPLLWLRVRQSNRSARRFYRRLGFDTRGRFAGYYLEPEEPAVIMAMDLDPAACGATEGGRT